MRYVSYRYEGADRVGVVEGGTVIPLTGVGLIGATTDAGELAAAAREAGASLDLGEVTLLPISPNPRRILCVGLNYRSHILETGRDLPTYPVLFPKYASSLIGARADIRLPPESTQVDYEGELAVVIGKGGRRIPQGVALEHVLGFTVANDITMRDFQYKTHQWLQGKAWDDSTPLGPVLVTPDEFDLDSATITTTVNGTVVQHASVGDLVFGVAELISLISTFTRLDPGDVILTGTPGGVGYRRSPQLLLGQNDVVRVTISGIGSVENTIRG